MMLLAIILMSLCFSNASKINDLEKKVQINTIFAHQVQSTLQRKTEHLEKRLENVTTEVCTKDDVNNSFENLVEMTW